MALAETSPLVDEDTESKGASTDWAAIFGTGVEALGSVLQFGSSVSGNITAQEQAKAAAAAEQLRADSRKELLLYGLAGGGALLLLFAIMRKKKVL